ncbi:glycosyltransferase family 4 protein [Gracilibacillus saliphilus]|uniref:glycosyltransferase family 4 protein n=1 Tax=Gracilibacillus saliphilus TaxID=543890 RepID=UPI0013D896A5|nr:glycosyltransferase family 4 protein [Gracilibacillus saliphilus]
MKILHINSYFSTSRFYKHFFDNQIDQNVDIDAFVPVSKSFETEMDFGEYTSVSRCYNSFDRYSYFLKQYKILKAVQSSYHINSYDVIHAHSLFTNGYIAYKLSRKYNIPYIVAVRNTDVNRFFKKMYHLRGIGIEILKNAQKVIFLSEPYKQLIINNYVPKHLKKLFLQKSHVIPNGIDDFWFHNRPINLKNIGSDVINLLYVGDINENKNLLTTVNAIKLLNRIGMEAKYTIVGKVRDKSIFNKLVKEPFVEYVQPIPKEKLISVYRKNDIFVMPSIRETFGLVYAEAMSQGIPVIYSRGQGFDGQFEDGKVGYSVDSKNEKEIANKISIIKKNYINFSENCVNNVSRFSWKTISKMYINLYYSVLRKK